MLQVRSECADAHTPPTRQKTKPVCLIGIWLSLVKRRRARGHSMRYLAGKFRRSGNRFHRHVANRIGSRPTCRGHGLSGGVVDRARRGSKSSSGAVGSHVKGKSGVGGRTSLSVTVTGGRGCIVTGPLGAIAFGWVAGGKGQWRCIRHFRLGRGCRSRLATRGKV